MRTLRWKYFHYPKLKGMDEIYNLGADPREMRNLINDPASQGALNAIKAKLERLKLGTR